MFLPKQPVLIFISLYKDTSKLISTYLRFIYQDLSVVFIPLSMQISNFQSTFYVAFIYFPVVFLLILHINASSFLRNCVSLSLIHMIEWSIFISVVAFYLNSCLIGVCQCQSNYWAMCTLTLPPNVYIFVFAPIRIYTLLVPLLLRRYWFYQQMICSDSHVKLFGISTRIIAKHFV